MNYIQQNFPQIWQDYCNAVGQQEQHNPDFCVIQLGGVCENITGHVVGKCGLQPVDNTQFGRLVALKQAQLLPRNVDDTLHQIRLARNKIAHGDGHVSGDEAAQLLQEMNLVLDWFHKIMSSTLQPQNFQHHRPAAFKMDLGTGCLLFILLSFAATLVGGFIQLFSKPLSQVFFLALTAALVYVIVKHYRNRRR